MKKRYLLAGAYGLAGAVLATKHLLRPVDTDWERDHAHLLHHANSNFIEIEGVRVHVQEFGERDAAPLILIHGFCASTFVWSDVCLPLAAAGFRVLVPDLIGYGFSAKPARHAYTIEAQARMICGLLDHYKIERATLVGSSYGGAVAAWCALERPERVERLVLVGAVSNDDVKRQRLLQLAASPIVGDLFSPLLVESFRLMRWRMKQVYAPENQRLFTPERMRAHHLPLRFAATQRAMLQTLRGWNATRIARDAHLITQPTLLLWGEHDKDVPLRDGEHLLEKIPDARLFVFRRCGHLPQEEQPAGFTYLVKNFCNAAH